MTNNAGPNPFQKFCATLPPVPSRAVYRANVLLRSDDIFPKDADEEVLYIALALTPAREALDWLERLYHERSANYARAAFGRLSNTNKGLVFEGQERSGQHEECGRVPAGLLDAPLACCSMACGFPSLGSC
ncbi:hypothetical protein ACTJK4_15860 [Ralstonia sp. 22111]|uniref:hypothetical protein n=1 Tax=Ralstonia sp. 22111 TaxID=3453878 RepID=UPI003F83ADBE